MEEKDNVLDCEDMVRMAKFTGELALKNITNRFKRNKIYTNVSSILISVNPYQDLGLYTEKYFELYRHDTKEGCKVPHVFAIARAAYQQLIYPVGEDKNQSILISGESGAGKTEATKLLLRYFAEQSKRAENKSPKSPQNMEVKIVGQSSIEEKLLLANTILEAFGNSKTTRNDNSSRFGKWINIYFSQFGKVLTGSITKYLLEGSRVITQDKGERNYNIFYQVLEGAKNSRKVNPNLEKKVTIGNPVTVAGNLSSTEPREFNYLNRSKCYTVKNRDDLKMFDGTLHALVKLGFEYKTINEIFNVLKAVLSLGNIIFNKGAILKGKQSSVIDTNSGDDLEALAAALGLEEAVVKRVLTVQDMTMPGGTFFSLPRTPEVATNTRNALATTIYSKLFDWLLGEMNKKFGKIGEHKKTKWIGILDIFGFEMFEHNSFEQLCINFANERLQQYFIKQVFRMELVLYSQEGLKIEDIPYPDNSDTVALLSKKGGVFAVLKEQIGLKNGSDDAFVQSIQKTFKKHKKFGCPRMLPSPLFTIKHYAEPVCYDSNGFLSKNRSKLSEDVLEMMKLCTNKVAKTLFGAPPPNLSRSTPPPDSPRAAAIEKKKLKRGGKRMSRFALKRGSKFMAPEAKKPIMKRKSVSSSRRPKRAKSIAATFQSSLTSLIKTIQVTESHFIRCIKPNMQKAPRIFEHKQVMRQLSTCGILHAVTIRKLGYTHRLRHDTFCYRYSMLVGTSPPKPKTQAAASFNFQVECKRLCNTFNLGTKSESKGIAPWQCGKTLVFYKQKVHEQLERLREKSVEKRLIKIQSIVRMFLTRQRFLRMRNAHRALKAAMHNPNSTLKVLQGHVLRCKEVGLIKRLLQAAEHKIELRVKAMNKLVSAMSTSKRTITARLSLIRDALAHAKPIFPITTKEQKLLAGVVEVLEKLSRALPIELSKAYESQASGLAVVNLVEESVKRADELKQHSGLLISIRQKKEVSHATSIVKKLDDLEMEMVLALDDRKCARLQSLLREAESIEGKPMRRGIVAEAKKAVEGLILEEKLESVYNEAEPLEAMYSVRKFVEASIIANSSLLKLTGSQVEVLLKKLVSKISQAEAVEKMYSKIEKALIVGPVENSEPKIKTLESGILEGDDLLDSVKSLKLENTGKLVDLLVEARDCLRKAEEQRKQWLEEQRREQERLEAERKAREAEEKRRVLEAERLRREAEKAERLRREAEEAERIRREAEEAERIRREAEEAERLRQEAEEAERLRQEAEKAERLRQEAAEAERLRQKAEEAERLRKEKEEREIERLRLQDEEARRVEEEAKRKRVEADRAHREVEDTERLQRKQEQEKQQVDRDLRREAQALIKDANKAEKERKIREEEEKRREDLKNTVVVSIQIHACIQAFVLTFVFNEG